MNAVVAQPLSSGEAKQALEAYGRALGAVALKPSDCKANPAEVAYSRARAAQLRIDGPALARALEAVDAERLATAAKLFEPRLTAAVAAGGRASGE